MNNPSINIILQRILVALIIIFWILLNLYLNLKDILNEGSFGIIYFWVFVFPAMIFMSQILFNSRFGWIISLILFLAFSVYVAASVTTFLVGATTQGPVVYSLADYLSLSVTVSIVFGLAYLLFIAKPVPVFKW